MIQQDGNGKLFIDLTDKVGNRKRLYADPNPPTMESSDSSIALLAIPLVLLVLIILLGIQ